MITPIYAAAIALVFVGLSFRTLSLRRRLGVGIGTGEDPTLTRAMRAHANFSEYVPLALILIYFLELRTQSEVWIHVLGGALILGRVLHAYGVSQVEENYRYRVAGMVLTLGCLISAAARVIISYVS